MGSQHVEIAYKGPSQIKDLNMLFITEGVLHSEVCVHMYGVASMLGNFLWG